jgi:hypothetical protein
VIEKNINNNNRNKNNINNNNCVSVILCEVIIFFRRHATPCLYVPKMGFV